MDKMKEEEMLKIEPHFKEELEKVKGARSEANMMFFKRWSSGSRLFLRVEDYTWKSWHSPPDDIVREVTMAFNNPDRFYVLVDHSAGTISAVLVHSR